MTRHRSWNTETYTQVRTSVPAGQEYTGPPWYWTNTQSIDSINHPNYRMLGRTSGDIGGAFQSDKSEWILSTKPIKNLTAPYGGYQVTQVSGTDFPQGPGVPAMTAPAIPAFVAGSLDAVGTRAIAQVLPTNPNASLAQFLGELKGDGLPSAIGQNFIRDKVAHYRSLGDEYLNVEFGWKPFVSDLRKLAKSVQDSERILKQYRKQSGKDNHRRFDISEVSGIVGTPTVTTNVTPSPQRSVGGSNIFYQTGKSAGTLTVSTYFYQKRWFEGCFTYFIPVGDSHVSEIERISAEANKLYGVRLTPELVWQLAPWSWATDWFGNIGAIMHNVTGFLQDDLVMRYGYVMEHTISSRVYDLSGFARKDGCTYTRMRVVNTRKLRVPATPFGFGLTWAGLSARQLAIAAALGISKL